MEAIENYELKLNLSNNGGVNIDLKITYEDGKITQYSPVIYSVFDDGDGIFHYTEDKIGNISNAVLMINNKPIEVDNFNPLEHNELYSIIDFQRY